MSFLLTCPNCGLRDVREFRYGGEMRERPADTGDDQQWTDYVYNHRNLPGLHREWWYHQYGCRCWFLAERNVTTNEVAATNWYRPA